MAARGNTPCVGHITLAISDIEFLQPDEFVLDDADLIPVDERPEVVRGRRRAPTQPVRAIPLPRRRPAPARVAFDDAQTAVRSVGRFARGR